MWFNVSNLAGKGTPVIYKDGCFLKITGNNTLENATLDGMLIALISKLTSKGILLCILRNILLVLQI